MANQPTPVELDSERPGVRDIWEVARLPGLFAIVTAAATWLIWYYTSMPCPAELAASIGCNPATVARYINVDIFGRMLTYSAITAAAGGVWNYDMFTKMRAVIAAETRRANEAEQKLAEYRQQAEEDRRILMKQAEDERTQRAQQAEEERRRAEEERRRAEEDRRILMQQAAEDRQAFLSALSELTTEIVRLRQQRNGSNGDAHNR